MISELEARVRRIERHLSLPEGDTLNLRARLSAPTLRCARTLPHKLFVTPLGKSARKRYEAGLGSKALRPESNMATALRR